MRISPARLAVLFNRYYSGTATAQETDELMELVRNAKDDEDLARLLKNAWENLYVDNPQFSSSKSNEILTSILQYADSEPVNSEADEEEIRHFPWFRYVAAAMFLLVGFGVLWKYKNAPKRSETVAKVPQILDVPPGGNKAVLTLANGAQIVLDSAKNGLLAKQGNAEVRKTDEGQLVYNSDKSDTQKLDVQINKLSTPKGGQYELVLSDGSKVWLNASSSISFPTVFANNARLVEITGEVYFEVAKDKSRPFRVSFSSSEVEVLGTSFNIMSYQDEASSKTTLVEGSVILKNNGGKKQLKPGQQAAVHANGQISTNSVDIEEVIAWKQGLFYFRDAGIEEIMRQASRWYDIEISYRGKIPIRQFTGKVSRNVNISELLTMLRYAGVNCKIEDNKVIVSS